MVRKWPGLWALSSDDMEAIAVYCEKEQPSSSRALFRISGLSVPGLQALKGHEASLFEAIAAARRKAAEGRKRVREGDEENSNNDGDGSQTRAVTEDNFQPQPQQQQLQQQQQLRHIFRPRLPAWASAPAQERVTVTSSAFFKSAASNVPLWMSAQPLPTFSGPSSPSPSPSPPPSPSPLPPPIQPQPMAFFEQAANYTEHETEYPLFPGEEGCEATALKERAEKTETVVTAPDLSQKEFALTPEQQQVLDLCLSGRSVCVLGYAGTGKSVLLRAAVKEFAGRNIKYAVTASTGIAAVSIEGRTIHSWSGLGLFEKKPLNEMMRLMGAVATINVKETDVLLLDEISMMSSSMIDTMDAVFREVRGRRDVVFGGMRVIFFGDFAQLPPVESGTSVPHYAFDSAAWDKLFPSPDQIVQLTRVMRQSSTTPEGAAFLQSLAEMRAGKLSEASLAFLNSLRRPLPAEHGIVPTMLYSTNKEVDADNQRELAKLPGRLVTFVAIEKGPLAGRNLLEKSCQAPRELSLKVGAQVVLLKNIDIEQGLANGSRGVVVSFVEPGSVSPIVRFTNGALFTFATRASFTVAVPGGTASREQFPLRLAWAITTHKSQGMTLDRVKVNLERAFAPGQAYVAFSRVRSPNGLELAGELSGSKVTSHPQIAKFFANLAKKRQEWQDQEAEREQEEQEEQMERE
jgi:hypothetical protein